MEQLTRVDFYLNPFMGIDGWPASKYLLNEVESFEAQTGSVDANDSDGKEFKLRSNISKYYEHVLKSLVFFKLFKYCDSKWYSNYTDAYADFRKFLNRVAMSAMT